MESLSWDDLRILLAVDRTGSFKRAGEVLRLSTSTVSRRLDALERDLGRKVVRRLAEGATLEPAVRPLVQLAERVQHDLAVAERDLRGEADARGAITVALGPGFVEVVSQVVARFRIEWPATRFELIVDQRAADVARREADLAVRTGKVGGDGVVYRLVGPLHFGVFASERYLARHGSPGHTLSSHAFVGYTGPMAAQPLMAWLRREGVTRFPVVVSSNDALAACALEGLGLAVLPVAVGRGLRGLIRVESPTPPPGKSVYLAMHRDLRQVPQVRRFADALMVGLRALLSGT
jgi:DNA-binding transcriptional LysR family regulator